MPFEWPPGSFCIASSMKLGIGRTVADLLNEEPSSAIVQRLEKQGIHFGGELLGKTPSELFPVHELGSKQAEIYYKRLFGKGITPASEIRKIDNTGGFSSLPRMEPP